MPRGSCRIKELRTERGLSQLQLAVKADVSQRTVQFAEAGRKQMKKSVLEAIADALEVQYEEIIDESEDAFLQWPWGLSRFVRTRCFPDDVAFCTQEADAITAIRKMRDSWQAHLESTGSDRATTVYGRADQLLDHEYDNYEARYLAIWKKNPNTLFFGVCDGLPTGVTVVLPVTDAAYKRMRDGSCSFMDITEADILPNSQNLILDSAVEFGESAKRRWYQVTDALSFAVFHQISRLSQSPNSRSFRVLSFGASPTNLERLETIGLVPNGIEMPKFKYSIVELTGDNSDLDIDRYNKQATWTHYLNLWRRMLPERTTLRLKRRLLMTILASYKGLLNRFDQRRSAA